MSRRNKDKGRLAPFVPVTKDTMKTPAWKALSHGARSLYIALKGRYNSRLQNAIYISSRVAVEELGLHSHRDSVLRWFRELQYYGFIVMVSLPHHGLNGHGKAAHYRLTEEWYLEKAPTRDYLKWDGELFHEQKSPEYYQRKGARFYRQKNRSRGPDVRTTLVQTCGPVSDKGGSEMPESGTDVRAISQDSTGPDVRAITSLTTPCPASALVSALSAVTDAAAVPDIPPDDVPWADSDEDLSIPGFLDRRAEIDLSDPATLAVQRRRLDDLANRLTRLEPLREAAE